MPPSVLHFLEAWIPSPLARSLVLLAGAALFGVAFASALVMLGRQWLARVRKGLGATGRRYLAGPLRVLVAIGFVWIALPEAELPAEEALSHIAEVLFILVLARVLFRATRLFEDFVVEGLDLSSHDNLRARTVETQVRALRNVVAFAIGVGAILGVLMTFEGARALGSSLLASAGVAGLVVGVAAQKSIGSVIAGIQIAITQPIRVGDAVIVEGDWGWIEEITLTYVVVKTWDWRRIVLPITYFLETPFQNWTRTSSQLLGSVFLQVDYRTPLEPLRQELERSLRASSLWDGAVFVLHVTDVRDKTMELRALMSAKDAPTTWDLRCEIREALVTFLEEKYPESLPRVRIDDPRLVAAAAE